MTCGKRFPDSESKYLDQRYFEHDSRLQIATCNFYRQSRDTDFIHADPLQETSNAPNSRARTTHDRALGYYLERVDD